ncbi:MAG: 4-hydroxyphenylpyruvate dioxygenase [Acidimicrobiales bacterium]
MTATAHPTTAPAARLKGWDSIEMWVGNARATAGFLSAAYGFEITGYAGPETGLDDRASYLLEQGRIRLVVTAGLDPESEIWTHVREHGDGAHDLAFVVDDTEATYTAAVARGARSVREPYELEDDRGVLRLSAVATYGETKHTFVDRRDYSGHYCPGFTADGLPGASPGSPVGLARIDHVVGNVEKGRLDEWVSFYEDVMGFTQFRTFDESQIATKYSALRSTVVTNGDPTPGRSVVMPLNEPADGLKRSQIQEYLDTYRGPGVQHVAMATADIAGSIAALRERGVRFLEANDDYFDDVRTRLAHLELPWEELRRLGILVDDEPDGHLLQLFTEPVTDRPTLFFEIIQRGGAVGFGEGNFKALFESIEREQDRRGNLD